MGNCFKSRSIDEVRMTHLKTSDKTNERENIRSHITNNPTPGQRMSLFQEK